MSKLRVLLAGLLFLLGFRRARRAREAPERIVPETRPDRGAETLLALLLGAAGLCSVGFVVVYALDDVPAQTQFLGLSIGLALAAFAAACVLTGKRLVPTEELEEPYPGEHPQEQEEVVRIVDESKGAITRRRLLGAAAGGAGAAFGVALLAPLVSLGPLLDTDRLYRTPWRAGRRLVDEEGRPYTAGEIQPDTFYTAYPEDADSDQIGAPLVVVRLEVGALELPSGRHGWAPHGILAYSKICTHAGCALALYRTPLYEPTTPGPALVCPCHYSTFDPATGGTVIFGPAGRPLPQLPLRIDGRGHLRAGGGFSGPVGPSWWGVRKK